MNLYLCSTPYHLLVSLCIIYDSKKDAMLYISTHDPNSEKIFINLSTKVKKNPYVKFFSIRKRSRIKERLRLEEFKDKLEWLKMRDKLEGATLVNFAWNPYFLYTTSNYLFKKISKAVFIEEGSILYACPRPSKKLTWVKKNIYGIVNDFHSSEKISNILVQYPEKYPEHLQSKLKYFSVESLFKRLKDNDRKSIINIFINENDMNKLLSLKSEKSIIILSQPLSEDNFISENEKIRLYQEIIKKYSDQYEIILKKHPREKTNYNFDNVIELDGYFPSELFSLLNLKFKKAIGICTGAITTIDADEKLNTDENFLQRRKNNA